MCNMTLLEKHPAYIAAVQRASDLLANPCFDWPTPHTPDLVPDSFAVAGLPLAEPEQWELTPLSGGERILYALSLSEQVTLDELHAEWGIIDILGELDALKAGGDCPIHFVASLDIDGTISVRSTVTQYTYRYWWLDDLWATGGYTHSYGHQMKPRKEGE